MSLVRLWAPFPTQVEWVTEDDRGPMEQSGQWWTAEIPAAARYAFSLDGGPPLPDPRAPRLPDGVHGEAQFFDPREYTWTDASFRAPPLGRAVIYELHVGTFSPEGTFDGAMGRLDHLLELGVTHVELMPVASFAGTRGWGYDGVGLFAVHEPYGGPEGMCRFVDNCHRRGLAVLLDVVYNHLGPEGNYLSRFGPYFTDRVKTPWGDAINLDGPGSDEVRRFFLDNAAWWLEGFHIDGLRLDAIHAFEDKSAVTFLEELAERKDALEASTGRSMVLIAESDLNDPRVIHSREAGGQGMDGQWADDLHHALHAQLTGERTGYYQDFGGWGPVAKGLRSPYIFDGVFAPFRSRRHGRRLSFQSGHRFVTYAQTHDQIGNRARGERLSHLCGEARAKVAVTLVLTAPSVPMLFQGEEWAASTPFGYFCDFSDVELAQAVREGRIHEFEAFGWPPETVLDPIDPATFEASRLIWEERDQSPHQQMHRFVRELLELRKTHPDLTDGRRDRVETRFDDGAGWLLVQRGVFRIGVSLCPAVLDVEPGTLLVRSDPAVTLDGAKLTLPADTAAVWRIPPV